MAEKDQAAGLKETYCPYCHLSTRADCERCLHCRKPLKTSSRPHACKTGERVMNRIASTREPATVLMVGPFEEDLCRLDHIFPGSSWEVRAVYTCREASALLRENAVAVVICERDLPDGNWKDLLDAAASLAHPPSLIVTSRLADEYLWGEVLNLGGGMCSPGLFAKRKCSGRSIQPGDTGTASGRGPCRSGRQSPRRGSCPSLGLGEGGRRWCFTA